MCRNNKYWVMVQEEEWGDHEVVAGYDNLNEAVKRCRMQMGFYVYVQSTVNGKIVFEL